ncbi:ABC transporter permease/substrate-binding protein [Sandaracinobacteroides hominis]|uniref:ABC transporter permease/substrate-binding protein n=1 Tax=Sandaracinobacteroides hominis TaxID=2780086 RepID=UPI0018F6FF2A|nr:ABC transporter permease/substrate-binding protein [Sandaracinobacteroides hominis]
MSDLLRLVQAHLLLSICAMIVALAIGLPIAILAARRPRIGAPILGLVSLLQTIPGLALLALFYPLLLFLGRATGLPIPALGFLPALLALALFALLPIIRNGVTAIRGVDPTLVEAADGLGMTGWQRLAKVELPLGAPVLLAGIRTATVWTIGTATLATTIGQPSLGDLIFSGLQTEDWRRVLTGCLAAAGLALTVDFLLGLIEGGLAQRRRWKVWTGAGLLLVAAIAALLPLGGRLPSDKGQTVVVGAKNFSEQYILAELIEMRLRAAGYRTERRDNLGSAIAYRALAAGDIDVYVDYSGTLWANVLGRTDTLPSAAMLQALQREMAGRDRVQLLGALGFENAYAFAMTRARATEMGIADLDDLARASGKLRLATDLEFQNRPEWQAVERLYRPQFREIRQYSPTFMYRALGDRSADAITAFSSDGRISEMQLITLPDPRRALPHYDAVLLLGPGIGNDPGIAAVLQSLVGSIPIDSMRAANWMVDRDADKTTPRQAAEWLDGKINRDRM